MANRDAKLIERTLKDFSLGVMSGNGGGVGSNYLMTIMDYYQVAGKHIDVDSLIALLEKYQVNLDAELDAEGQSSIRITLNNDYNRSIDFGYDVCSGGADIRIFNVALEDLETAATFRTILTTNKEKIESFEITKDSIRNMVFYSITADIVINQLDVHIEGGHNNYLTIQEALSIFK